jgi:hypothetical protein
LVSTESSNIVLNTNYFQSASQPANQHRWQLTTDNASTTYNYTPFTYPFPLDATGLPNPSGGAGSTQQSPPPTPNPPTNLVTMVQ